MSSWSNRLSLAFKQSLQTLSRYPTLWSTTVGVFCEVKYKDRWTQWETALKQTNSAILPKLPFTTSEIKSINSNLLNGLLRIENTLFHDAFIQACIHGNLEVVQWVDTFSNSFFLYDYQSGLEHACLHGNTEIAKWIMSTHSVNQVDITLFDRVCKNGHLNTAKWLTTKFDYSYPENAFINSCEKGHTAVVQWLLSKFPQLKERPQDDALIRASRYGHLEIVKLLDSTFEYNSYNSYTPSTLTDAYKQAQCDNFEVMLWLRERLEKI